MARPVGVAAARHFHHSDDIAHRSCAQTDGASNMMEKLAVRLDAPHIIRPRHVLEASSAFVGT